MKATAAVQALALRLIADRRGQMPASRGELHLLVDRIPEGELQAAQRFLQFLSEETIGPVFARKIHRGIAQADAGETTTCRDYDEMLEKLLSDR